MRADDDTGDEGLSEGLLIGLLAGVEAGVDIGVIDGLLAGVGVGGTLGVHARLPLSPGALQTIWLLLLLVVQWAIFSLGCMIRLLTNV